MAKDKDKPVDIEAVKAFLQSEDCYAPEIAERRFIETVRRCAKHPPTYDMKTDDEPGALERAREFLAARRQGAATK